MLTLALVVLLTGCATIFVIMGILVRMQ